MAAASASAGGSLSTAAASLAPTPTATPTPYLLRRRSTKPAPRASPTPRPRNPPPLSCSAAATPTPASAPASTSPAGSWRDLCSLNAWVVRDYGRLVDSVAALEPALRRLSDEQLKAKTAEFRGRLTRGETLADVQAGASAALTAIAELHRFSIFPNKK